jgi:subtilisin family serine protease
MYPPDAPSFLRSTLFLALALGAACGGSQSSSSDVVNCTNDSRVAAYVPNLAVTSAGGGMKFVLVSSDPAPPARGTDIWALRVTDASGQPLPNLSLSVLPFMPDHGHGTSVTPQITSNGGGNYTVSNLYFFMPGVWRITFTSASPSDTAAFFFCVPG